MNRWEKDFEESSIHGVLNRIEGLRELKIEDLSLEHKQERERLFYIVNVLKKLLAKCDKKMIDVDMINEEVDSLSNDHQTTLTELIDIYIRDKDLEDIQNIADRVTPLFLSLISTVSSMVKRFSNPMTKEDKESLEEYLFSIEQSRISQKEELGKFKLSLKSFSEKLQDIHTGIDNLDNYVDVFKEEKEEEYNSSILNMKSSLSESLEEIEKKYKSVISDSEVDLKKQKQILLDKYSDSLSFIQRDSEEKHEIIKRLHGLVATDSVRSGYISKHKEEKDAADYWRDFSVKSAQTAAGWLVVLFFFYDSVLLKGGQINIGKALMCSSITFIIISISAFAARQSYKHREESKLSHWMALELESFDPFVDNLKESDKEELKKELVNKLFGKVRKEKEIIKDSSFSAIVGLLKDIKDLVTPIK